jgi:hypothetical protein
MPTPVRESILAAIKTALDGVSGATAYRNIYLPLKETELPAMVLFDGDQTSQVHSVTQMIHNLLVEVECTVEGTDVGATQNDIYAKVVQAVCADTTLGGYSVDVREAGMFLDEIDDSRASTVKSTFTINFEVDYLTKEGNPYQIG